MDKRYKPISGAEHLRLRIAILEALPKTPTMPLNKAIHDARTQLHLTMAEYARLSGVAERTIYNVEKGRANPSLKIANKLLRPLGLTMGIIANNLLLE